MGAPESLKSRLWTASPKERTMAAKPTSLPSTSVSTPSKTPATAKTGAQRQNQQRNLRQGSCQRRPHGQNGLSKRGQGQRTGGAAHKNDERERLLARPVRQVSGRVLRRLQNQGVRRRWRGKLDLQRHLLQRRRWI